MPGSVITDPAVVAERGRRIATGVPIEASDGTPLVAADSLCVHGDTPGAVVLATALRRSLADDSVRVAPFRVTASMTPGWQAFVVPMMNRFCESVNPFSEAEYCWLIEESRKRRGADRRSACRSRPASA